MIHTLMALDKVKSACPNFNPNPITPSPRGPLSRLFGLLRGQNGLKMGSFHPFVHPKWSRMRFGKMRI